MSNLYPITPVVRMLAVKLADVRKEFEAAKKLGWIASAVRFKRDGRAIQRRMSHESQQAAANYLLRLEGPKI
jgi:hypothetical protein